MIDITRRLHPDRLGMFTCAYSEGPLAIRELIADPRGARQAGTRKRRLGTPPRCLVLQITTDLVMRSKTNYGTRLDYILITPELLPWVKGSDIQPAVVGSDHCPVYIDFHDEIEDPVRGKLDLWSLMNPGRQRSDKLPDPPAFAARFYPEFSGKQQTLQSFFGKKSDLPPKASPLPSPAASDGPAAKAPSMPPPPSSSAARAPSSSQDNGENGSNGNSKKGKERSTTPAEAKKTGQQELSSFFKPPAKIEPPKKKRKKSKTGSPPPASSRSSQSGSAASRTKPSPSPGSISRDGSDREVLVLDDDEADPALDAEARAAASAEPYNLNADSASAWSNIFAAKPPPLCEGHQETSRLWTVNKPGVNKGRRFYLCAR